ncbi:hypothetical protein PFISCL1PPCAC_4488, partial [Pristionchus fissidentatus]
CYEPKDCFDGAKLVEVTTELTPDCYVSFKFHPYSHYWYRIVMESTNGTDKIEFVKTSRPPKTILTCEKKGGIPKIVNTSFASGKIRCEFEINQQFEKNKIIDLNDQENLFATVSIDQ